MLKTQRSLSAVDPAVDLILDPAVDLILGPDLDPVIDPAAGAAA